MANDCGVCKKALKTNLYAKCTVCKNGHHPTCVKITDFRKTSEAYMSSWVCPQCRGNKTNPEQLTCNQPTDSTCNNSPPTLNKTTHLIIDSPATESGSLSELTTEIKLLRGDVGDLKSQLKSLTEHLTQCSQRLELSEAGLLKAETKILELEEKVREIPLLKSTIEILQEKAQTQAQASLTNQIEILGINEAPNENPVHIILTAAAKIGVKVADTDIDYAARVGPRSTVNSDSTEKHPRPIVVKFLRRDKRNEFLRAGKSRHNFCSADLNIPGINKTIYFNERLTKENRLLFRAAKQRSKEAGYKYCWVKNGSVNIRKQEGYSSVTIKSMEDLLHHCLPTNPDADV